MKKHIFTPLLMAAVLVPVSAAHAQFEGILFGAMGANTEGNAPTTGGGFNDIAPGAGAVSLDANGIVALQTALTSAGFYKGAIDGQMTDATGTALKNYQRSQHLDVSGAADAHTLDRLGIGKRFGITAGTSFNN
jgi:peptidoglycan hydrolase-like protein with peptidoglycan-binding domain